MILFLLLWTSFCCIMATCILWCDLQFSSHRIYNITHTREPANSAVIVAVKLLDAKTILFTTSVPHNMKSKGNCGELLVSKGSDVGVMAVLLETALKVISVPTPLQFTIQSPDVKSLQQSQLATFSAHLQSGQLQLTFGSVPLLDSSHDSNDCVFRLIHADFAAVLGDSSVVHKCQKFERLRIAKTGPHHSFHSTSDTHKSHCQYVAALASWLKIIVSDDMLSKHFSPTSMTLQGNLCAQLQQGDPAHHDDCMSSTDVTQHTGHRTDGA